MISQINNVAPKKNLDLSPRDLYITFNYTNLLQEIYQIPEENILHVHGSLKQEGEMQRSRASKAKGIVFPQQSSIQFGSLYNDPKQIEDELVKGYGRDDCFGASIEPGINKLINYCEASFKDLKSNYDVLKQFISKKGISNVTIIWHPIMRIDNSYYEDIIVPALKNCVWTFYYYKNDNDARKFIEAFGIFKYEMKKLP